MEIVIISHCSDKNKCHLDRRQIIRFGEKMKATVNGERIVILSSIAAGAREIAEVLGEIFGIGVEEHDVLEFEGMFKKLPKILELVRSKKDVAEIVILVTHLNFVEVLPNYFGQNEFNPNGSVTKGEE